MGIEKMINRSFAGCIVIAAILLSPGCREKPADSHLPHIVVTNSYLQSATMDIAGDRVVIGSLCPPGMCPGHFDLSPGNVRDLRKCELVIRFDFQSQLDKSLAGIRDSSLPVESIAIEEGMCIPQTYIDTCSRIAQRLSAIYPADADFFRRRFQDVRDRADVLTAEVRAMNLSGKVLASRHQAAFCKWLGFDVAANFVGSDMASVANVQAALMQARDGNIKWVVANKQEGTAFATSLADAAKVRQAVFSNFPDISSPTGNFEAMIRNNIRQVQGNGTD
jgi:zinc transport system substrate-binding protein